jgi:hypothetical protein
MLQSNSSAPLFVFDTAADARTFLDGRNMYIALCFNNLLDDVLESVDLGFDKDLLKIVLKNKTVASGMSSLHQRGT